MKTSIIILAIIVLFTSCGKGPMPLPAEPQLPPITTIGANTFGCKVNGVVAQTNVGIGFLSTEGVEFDFKSSDTELNIHAITRSPDRVFNIRMKISGNIIGTHKSNLVTSDGYSFFGSSNEGKFISNDSLVANVTISKCTSSFPNPEQKGDILCGTFDIYLSSNTGIIHLSDGRFDIKE
jgi:hypothetical protein